jgi:hypothetical protein
VAVAYLGIDFRLVQVSAFVRNAEIYEETAPGKWANRSSAYPLRYSGDRSLTVEMWFEDPEAYSTRPLELSVYANRELVLSS